MLPVDWTKSRRRWSYVANPPAELPAAKVPAEALAANITTAVANMTHWGKANPARGARGSSRWRPASSRQRAASSFNSLAAGPT